jgi:formate dehydrogenase iron-sulfur subunit
MSELPTANDPAGDTGWVDHPPRMGFLTDTSLCIGCKACEVACKTWNGVPEDGLAMLGSSYDNTGGLGASTWRHVAFIEQKVAAKPETLEVLGAAEVSGIPVLPGNSGNGASDLRWLMSSDVCKHCTHAACLDVCPTGSLMRTEFGTVVVQEDICNGCGYCVPACPYGVIDRREEDGRAWKCTLCYDRLKHDQTPACAQACPTQSIQFGPVDELRIRGAARVEELHERGETTARMYGENPNDGVGGAGAMFLLLDEPEVYGLPPDPVVATRDVGALWKHAAKAAAMFVTVSVAAFVGRRP